jgi:P27 family predicted phage terminase small subunit
MSKKFSDIPVGMPKRPTWLRGEARKEWDRIVPILDAANLLTQVDRSSLADYCVCWARLCEAEADIAKRGLLIKGRRDALVKNPSVQLARQYRVGLQRWCAMLGLTLARGPVAIPGPGAKRPGVDPIESAICQPLPPRTPAVQ